MPKKKQSKKPASGTPKENNAYIAGAGVMQQQPITETLISNYMPYAMSAIVSRALPDIDGFKPSHRKLLYTMYQMGLLTGGRVKSANIVGQTMRLNPHGDAAIYDTMVRLSKGNETLLHPYVDSKGSFGKAYSRDMAYAAPRYTEAKLMPICNELFSDIKEDTVEFVPNYDNTMDEPTLFPTTFPAILVNANTGIAVSMATNICPFRLSEVCETAIAYLRHPKCDLFETLKGPDFPGGGLLIYDQAAMEQIYSTGRGSFKVRAKYRYDAAAHCIEVYEIPPTTTVEAIIDKAVELIKANKIREISDLRDETDLNGLKLVFDCKRGVDPDKLMTKLYRLTPLEDSFSCNFNLLIGGVPKVLGVREILEEWTAFRLECVRRRTYFRKQKLEEKLHLLKGLQAILLDIDKAIRIVRQTESEADVVPNLMIGFGIDRVQAEYVAEIRLRHLNREYILRRTEEIGKLEEDIKQLDIILSDEKERKKLVISELKEVSKKYGQPRRTDFIYPEQLSEEQETFEELPDYPVNLFVTAEGYVKKISPQSLRMNAEQKVKENDRVVTHLELTNRAPLLFFTDRGRAYKTTCSVFGDTKASQLGDFAPVKLEFEDGEKVTAVCAPGDYSGQLVMFFENGKATRVPLSAYETKTNRKRLTGAVSDKSPLVALFAEVEAMEYVLTSSNGRRLILSSAMITLKTTRNNQGMQVMTQKKGCTLIAAEPFVPTMLQNPHRFRSKTLPAAGMMPRLQDLPSGEQE